MLADGACDVLSIEAEEIGPGDDSESLPLILTLIVLAAVIAAIVGLMAQRRWARRKDSRFGGGMERVPAAKPIELPSSPGGSGDGKGTGKDRDEGKCCRQQGGLSLPFC